MDPNEYQRLQAEAVMFQRRQEEARRQEELQKQQEEQRRQEETRQRQAEEQQRQQDEARRQEAQRKQQEDANQANERRQQELARREAELRKQSETAQQMATGQSADIKTAQGLAILQQVNPAEYAKLQESLRQEAPKANVMAEIVKAQREAEKNLADVEEKAKKPEFYSIDKKELDKARKSIAESGAVIDALTSKDLAAYVKTTKSGQYVIEVERAIRDGVSKKLLYAAGVSPARYVKAEVNIKRGIQPLHPDEAELREKLSTIVIPTLEGNIRKSLERKLKPYLNETGGIDIVNALANGIKPATLKAYGVTQNNIDNALGFISTNKLKNTALLELKDYRGEDGYYIASYIKDKYDDAHGDKRNLAIKLAERTLLNAGFTSDEIARARADALAAPGMSIRSAKPDKEAEAKFLNESPDTIQKYLGGSGVKSWTYAALLGRMEAKDIYDKLNVNEKRQVIDYYLARDGKVPDFAESVAASPIPQIESMFFVPLGKMMSNQKVEGIDIGIGVAQLALWVAPVVGPATSKLVAGALPKLGINAITSNVAAGIAGKVAQAAIPTGAGAFFLTEHVTKLLPDENVPLNQKVLAISFDTLLITTGIFGMAGAIRYARGAKINSAPEMALKDTMTIVRETTPLTAQESQAIEQALRRIQKAIINNNKTELVQAAKQLELAQKGRVLFSEASRIRLYPDSYLVMARDVALKMKPEQINVNTRFIRSVADYAANAKRINQFVEEINREIGASYTPRKMIEARGILSDVGNNLGKINKKTTVQYNALQKVKGVPKYKAPERIETLNPIEYQVYRTIKKIPDDIYLLDSTSKAEYAAYLAKKIPERVRIEGFSGAVERYGMETVRAVYPKLTQTAIDAEKYLYKIQEPQYLAMKNRVADNLNRYIHNTLMETPILGGEVGSLPPYERLISEELVGYRGSVLSPAEMAKKFPGFYKNVNLKDINGVIPAEIVSDIVSTRPNIFVTKGGSWKLVPTVSDKSKFKLKYPLYTDDPYLKSEILRTLSGKYQVYGEGGAVEIGTQGETPVDVKTPEGELKQLVTYTVKPTAAKSKDLQLTRGFDIPLIQHEEPVDEMASLLKGKQLKYIDNQPVYRVQFTPISGKNQGTLMEVTIPLYGNTTRDQAEYLVGKITKYVAEFGMEQALNAFGKNAVTAVYPYAIDYALTEMDDYTPPAITRPSVPTKPIIDEPRDVSSGLATALKEAERKSSGKYVGGGTGSRGLTPDQELGRMTGAQRSDRESGGQGSGVSVESSPVGATATIVKPIPAIQTETQPEVKPQVKPEVKPESKTSTMASVATATAPDILIKPSIKPIPVIKAETQPEEKPQVKPQTKAETMTGIDIDVTAPAVKAENVQQEMTDIEITKTPRLPVSGKSRKEKTDEWTEKEIKSAIAWKDGFNIIALKSPYRRGIDEKSFHESNVPAGLAVLDIQGKGSQQASAKVVGKLPKKLTVDVGNQDVHISQIGKDKISLRHVRDVRGTSGDLTIKRRATAKPRMTVQRPGVISKKKGKFYHTRAGGGEIISRRPIRGY